MKLHRIDGRPTQDSEQVQARIGRPASVPRERRQAPQGAPLLLVKGNKVSQAGLEAARKQQQPRERRTRQLGRLIHMERRHTQQEHDAVLMLLAAAGPIVWACHAMVLWLHIAQ